MSNAQRVPLFVDTDPGVDDALALLMLLGDPGVEIVGVGSVAGNVELELATLNAARVLEQAGATEVPLFAGATRPLAAPPIDAKGFHGADGLGDAGLELPRRAPRDEHAALALCRLAREHAGRLVLLALGPLTNIALALALDPGLGARLARVVVMGGAHLARGNVSAAAEFNAFVDPDAASRVFEELRPIELVTWEATLDHLVAYERFESLVAADGARARFARAITRRALERERERGMPGFEIPDPLAAALALDRALVSESEEARVRVERFGESTRGATIVDRRLGARALPPNARIARRFDLDGVLELLARGLSGR